LAGPDVKRDKSVGGDLDKKEDTKNEDVLD